MQGVATYQSLLNLCRNNLTSKFLQDPQNLCIDVFPVQLTLDLYLWNVAMFLYELQSATPIVILFTPALSIQTDRHNSSKWKKIHYFLQEK